MNIIRRIVDWIEGPDELTGPERVALDALARLEAMRRHPANRDEGPRACP